MAAQVIQVDHQLDRLQQDIDSETLRLLGLRQPMASDLREILAAVFVAKNLERIGDHATNIAETIHFLVVGQPLTTARPKGDTSSQMVVIPTDAENQAAAEATP